MLFIGIFLVVNFSLGVNALLDPSRVYCDNLGYNFEINNTIEGDQGICVISDSIKLDSWDFLKGKVGQTYSYCSKEGYGIKIIINGTKCAPISSLDCAVCIISGQEIEVTTLMNLSTKESICGDNLCYFLEENYGNCPKDCNSGVKDNYCDKVSDGICDPDCNISQDADCVVEGVEFPDVGCIDGDGVCIDSCVESDNDCVNITFSEQGEDTSPRNELFPEITPSCEYDGVCNSYCLDKGDVDCECINPDSESCKLALANIYYNQENSGNNTRKIIYIIVISAIFILVVIIAYLVFHKKRFNYLRA